MNERELLPCPFCGGEADYIDAEEFYVMCMLSNGCAPQPAVWGKDRTEAAEKWNRRAALQAAPEREPDGYAYRYPALMGDGTVIRFETGGREINASKPIEAIPYWLGTPPTSATPRINIRLETHGGSTYIPVIRVEQEDDGSFTAVSNYWPETNSATVDNGPWQYGVNTTDRRAYLQSDDFTHDVRLYIDGDFASDEQRDAYGKALAQRLNTSATVEAATEEFVRETLQGIVSADWRKWEELASPAEFERWVKARCNHALHTLASQPAQPECNRPNVACAYPVCGDDCRHRAQPAQPQAEATTTPGAGECQPTLTECPTCHNDLAKCIEVGGVFTTPQAEAQAGETRGIKPNWKAMYESQLHATLEQADECDRLRAQLAAQPQAVEWRAVDVRQALPVTDRQDVYPETRYVYKRLYERDEVCGYAWVELPTFDNDALLRALRNNGKEGA